MKAIQFGSGSHTLEGWMNLDLPGTDVRKKLEFEDNSIDFIFHEHLIEHLDEVDGFNFMKECYRILKPGGVMRVSCPSVDGIIEVYQNWDNQNLKYKSIFGSKASFINSVLVGEVAGYSAKRFNVDGSICSINNSNMWHKYFYDREDFNVKLTRIGFSNIEFLDKHESSHKELTGLERRFGKSFNKKWLKYQTGSLEGFDELEMPEIKDINLEATK